MAIELYDISVGSYLQVVGAVHNALSKGAEQLVAADNLVEHRIFHDMLPFSFQLRSVVHHSVGAVESLQSGVAGPPPAMPDMDYSGLQQLIDDTLEKLKSVDPATINALAGGTVTFKMGDIEIPFTAENFVQTFSLPNLYFHATTAYTILRSQGVSVGKMDFLGAMRVGV